MVVKIYGEHVRHVSVEFTEWCGKFIKYGEHVRVALCGIQFVFLAVVIVPCQRYSAINISAYYIDTSIIEAETYPVPGMCRNMEV